jgi:hypothetical protein
MSDQPKKAYFVEKISRAVTLLIVYADSIEDAKRRAAMEGQPIDTQHEGRGFGHVRRAPREDLS